MHREKRMKITLATLPDATAQEVFDQVARHLLTQGEKSLLTQEAGSIKTGCAYRGVGGLMCGAGCLISDTEYHESMEGKLWVDLVFEGEVPNPCGDLIGGLQITHDTCDPSVWCKQLSNVAFRYNLKDTVLKEML